MKAGEKDFQAKNKSTRNKKTSNISYDRFKEANN